MTARRNQHRGSCVVAFLGLLTLALMNDGANAASIVNRDNRDHKITIVEREQNSDHVLRPAQTLDNVCTNGCVIRLNDDEDEEYEIEGSDAVSIEDGELYYEGDPDAPRDRGTDGSGSKQQR